MIGTNVTEMIAEIVAARKAEATGHTIFENHSPPPYYERSYYGTVADAYGEVIHL